MIPLPGWSGPPSPGRVANSTGSWCACAVIRRREIPSGTLGGRKQATAMPRSRRAAVAAIAASAPGILIDWTAPAPGSTRPRSSGCPARVSQMTLALRARSPIRRGSARASERAAAAAAAGARAVSNRKVREVFTRCSRSRPADSPPSNAAPPCAPSALESVAVATTCPESASPAARTAEPSRWRRANGPRPPPARRRGGHRAPRPRPAAPRPRAPSRWTREPRRRAASAPGAAGSPAAASRCPQGCCVRRFPPAPRRAVLRRSGWRGRGRRG